MWNKKLVSVWDADQNIKLVCRGTCSLGSDIQEYKKVDVFPL
jgi:hypothetical protein